MRTAGLGPKELNENGRHRGRVPAFADAGGNAVSHALYSGARGVSRPAGLCAGWSPGSPGLRKSMAPPPAPAFRAADLLSLGWPGRTATGGAQVGQDPY